MTNSHSASVTTPTPETPLTPSLFEQIQSLFLLQNSPIQLLYSQFQLSLSVLFSILHDHSTQSLRRAIDEHTYLCAQRAHLELILETENVAIALAKTENPTQEQRRRLGTLNATLKTSFKNLQALRDSLLNDDDTNHTTSTHTTHKPPHTKRTTTRRAPAHTNNTTNTNANTITTPTPTATPTTPPPSPNHTTPLAQSTSQSTYSNTPNTNPHTIAVTTHSTSTPTTTPNTTTHTIAIPAHTAHNTTQRAPTQPHTAPPLPPTHDQIAQHPAWIAISPHLSPEARQVAHSLPPHALSYLLSGNPNDATEALEYQAALNRANRQSLTT